MQALTNQELELVCGGGGYKKGGKSGYNSGTSINVAVITAQTALLSAEQANVNLYGKDNKQSNTAFIAQSIG